MPRVGRQKSAAKAKASLTGIAQRLSLSLGTVSNAFNRPELVAPETLKRVRHVAEEVGYVPHHHARVLRTRRSGQLGLLVSSLENPFYVEMLEAVERAATARGFDVVMASTGHWDLEREVAAARYLASLRVEGVIALNPASGSDLAHFESLVQHGCKLLLRSTPAEQVPGASSLHVAVEHGVQKAVEHVLELGHRRLALVLPRRSVEQPASRQDLRITGTYAALRQAGLSKADLELIPQEGPSVADAFEATRARLAERAQPRPTAILATNDHCALGVISAIRQAGLTVPEDISVIGVDGIKSSAFYDPPLTTIAQPHTAFGEQAVQMLLDQIKDPTRAPDAITLEPELVIRNSTGPARLAP